MISGCIDKKFEKMLHAYELNLLHEQDKFDFEVHLYRCEYCFKKVEKFKKTAELLQHSQKVRDTLEQIANNKTQSPSKVSRKKIWSTLIPVSIAAIFFVFLILKDWQIDIYTSKEAVASENRLAIMYFDNFADPSDSLKLGEITTNLLIADLSESHYLNLISSQRLADLLCLLDLEDTKHIDKITASEIAKKVDAKWILTGAILATNPNLIVTIQLLELKTGDILTSRKIEGTPDDDIFSIIDKLTIQVKNNLSLPSEALLEPDPEIADFTTNSTLAYRYYLEGIKNYNKMYYTDAKKDFELALKHDTTFAMAYYYLAQISDGNLIHKAVEYSEGSGTIDRLYIKTLAAFTAGDVIQFEKILKEIINKFPDEKNAYYSLGNYYFNNAIYDDAINYLSVAIKIDPKFKMAYNQLAYTYSRVGNFEKALWAIDRYIDLAPGEANPLDTKAEIYAINGMLDNAIESYKRALSIKPDYYASLQNLSLMYMFKGEYSKADSCLNLIITGNDTTFQEMALRYKTYIPQFKGKFQEAIDTINNIIATYSGNIYAFHFIKSLIYIKLENWDLAFEEIEKTIELHDLKWPDDKIRYRYFRIHILAKSGDIEHAIKLAGKLKENIERLGTSTLPYWYAEGSIAMVKKDYDRAILYFRKSLVSQNMFFTHYMLAEAYQEAERYEESITELEELNKSFSLNRGYYTIWSTMLHYNLGLAYEYTGQTAKAIEQYGVFLDLWKDADKGIKEIKNARESIARLQNQS